MFSLAQSASYNGSIVLAVIGFALFSDRFFIIFSIVIIIWGWPDGNTRL